MLSEAEKEDPVARFARLGQRDRQAVLRQLSLEERSQIEQALRSHEKLAAAELERQQRIDRQFLGYSPELASLIEASENDTPESMTDTAARACWEIHSALLASQAPAMRPGLLGLLDRFSEWLGPSRKSRQ